MSDFDVDDSDRQTREHTAIPLHLNSSLLHQKWAKQVDHNMTENVRQVDSLSFDYTQELVVVCS